VGRKSKLTPEQWATIERRLIGGEAPSDLAREYGVHPAQITRRGLPQIAQNVLGVAQKLADASASLATLPPLAQIYANSLAQKLIAISQNLACAAEAGSATAYRLNSLANSEVSKVDDAAPMASLENLRNVGVLTKLANDSASIALNLLAANKETVKKLHEDDEPKEPEKPLRPQISREQWLKEHGVA
jgi:hypothetical protein